MRKLKNTFKDIKTANFVRKPSDLQDMESILKLQFGCTENYKIKEVWELTVSEMKEFKNNFFGSYDFLKGKGGGGNVKGEYVVSAILVVCSNLDWFVVNPEGYDYPRYIAKF